MHDQYVREEVSKLLLAENAHLNFESVVSDFPLNLRGVKPLHSPHSAWQLLEHMRIAQWDIVEYTLNTSHQSPDFPAGYWPTSETPSGAKQWDDCVAAIKHDIRRMQKLVSDSASDIYARLAGGNGTTILRQALMLADHNAYHVGQLMMVKRSLMK